MIAQPAQVRGESVSQDWIKPLHGEKSRVYEDSLQSLEQAYAMFSVNLNEALECQYSGRSGLAYELLGVSIALCRRLAAPMQSLLRTMLEHAKHFGTTANLSPLDPGNFQHSRSRRVALFNDLFSRVLLTRKSQFLHKISALADLVDDLDSGFEETVEDLCDDRCVYPEPEWDLLGSVHYDLNTCLRETDVLLKSFLHALPGAQLTEFETNLRTRTGTRSKARVSQGRHLAHRRIAVLKGQ